MKLVTIIGEQVHIPEGQHEFSLEMYQKLHNISDAPTILSVLIDKPLEQVKALPMAVFVNILENFKWYQDTPIETGKFDNKVELDGITYVIDFESITLGQQADVEILQKDLENNLALIIAILLKPVGVDYNYYDSKSMADKVKKLSILKVREMLDFFLLLRIMLEKDSETSILPMVEALVEKHKATLSSASF